MFANPNKKVRCLTHNVSHKSENSIKGYCVSFSIFNKGYYTLLHSEREDEGSYENDFL